MSKILFLDIDGPMIPYRCLVMPGQTAIMTLFDPVAVSLINYLCEEYDFKIVLHSSWVRMIGGKEAQKHCVKQGLKLENFHEDGWTNEDMSWRYSRVAEWLKRHPEVDNYVIVDDDPYAPDKDLAYPHPEGMPSRVVLINYYTGFLFQDYISCLALTKTEQVKHNTLDDSEYYSESG